MSAMAVEMNGWAGDGNGYVGNLNLRPAVAETISGSVDWHDSAKQRVNVKITPYYTYIHDYIDANRCPIITNSNGCSSARYYATSGYVTLQFANHDAQLAGVDGSSRLTLGGNAELGDFALNGVLSYVRGENLDTGGSLYNIMPVTTRLTLEHRRDHWSDGVELQAVDKKRNVDAVRNELRVPGYALVNVRTGYLWGAADAAGLRFDAGIDNVSNRSYALPLGGRYWADKTGMTQVHGPGRSYFGGLTFRF
jgi:iron complex outermembrane receptor protein